MSNIFLVSGLLLSLIILIFFCNLVIMGQRQKITVERILGLSRRECCISSLAGLLLIATAGIGIGSVSGWLLTKQLSNTISYDTLYSIRMVQTAVNDSYGIINGSFWTAVSSMIILMILVLAIAGGYLKDVLKDTPLTMLGKLED